MQFCICLGHLGFYPFTQFYPCFTQLPKVKLGKTVQRFYPPTLVPAMKHKLQLKTNQPIVDKYVGTLDVTVQEVVLMTTVQSFHQLTHQ